MFDKILKFVQDNLIVLILIVIVGGLLNVKFFGGYEFSAMICLLAAVVMIYPSLVPLSFNKIGKIKKHKGLIIVSVLLNFIVAPLAAYFAGAVFLADEPALRLGLFVLALLPGGGMVTTWAMKSKADMMTTVGVILINLLLAIVITPFGISFSINKLGLNETEVIQKSDLLGAGYIDKNSAINIPESAPVESCAIEKTTGGLASCDFGGGDVTPFKIAIPIVFIIIFPLVLALWTQKSIIKRRGLEYFTEIKGKFSAFSNLGLLLILFILMSLENNITIFEQSSLVLSVGSALLVFYGLIFIIPWFLYKKVYFNKEGKALLWGSYLRYITLALGLGISLVFQNPKLAPIILVIVLSYLIQIPSSFIIAKMLKKG